MSAAQHHLKQNSLQASPGNKDENTASGGKRNLAQRGICETVTMDAHAQYEYKCNCVVSISMSEWMCSPCCSSKYGHWMRTEDGGVTDSSSQVASISILFAASWVWNFDEEQFASLDGYEEDGFVRCHQKAVSAHYWLRNTAHPTTNRHPPSALHPPPSWQRFFYRFGQRLFLHYVVWPRAPAGGPFIKPPWGFSEFQGHLPNLSTHT